MDLYKLKYFHEVASANSFSAAAKKYFISQSAISQSVMQLESSLNEKLFERSGKKIVLTEAGEVLFKHTSEVFKIADMAVSEISSLGKEMKGEIKFAMTPNVGIYLLQATLKKWIKKYPKAKLVIKYNLAEDCINLLKEGIVDFVIIPVIKTNRQYHEVKIAEDKWTVVASTKHPLALKKKVLASDLKKYSLMVSSKNNPRHKDAGQKSFEKLGVYPEILLEANDAETLKNMTLNNFGLSFLPQRMIQKEVKSKKLKDLNIKGLVVPHNISVLYKKTKTLSFLVKKFIEMLV